MSFFLTPLYCQVTSYWRFSLCCPFLLNDFFKDISYIEFLAATSSSRNTPWLLLLLFLWIMMMLPLIINSYNLVSFHQNLMKLVLNWRISHCLSFPGNISFFFLFFLFWKNLILVRLWTWKNFSPYSLGVNFEVLKLLHLCMDCHEAWPS